MQDTHRDPIPNNLRLLALLERIGASATPVTPTELIAELGLPKPTVHRLVVTLEAEGYIQRQPDGRGFSAGARMNRLSAGVVASIRQHAVTSMVLRDLSERIGETCNISMREGDAMVYIDRAETKWPLQIALPIGTRVPMHCSAAGKTWLASLTDTELALLLEVRRLERRAPNTITDPNHLIDEVRLSRARGWGEDNEEAIEGMIALAVPILDQEQRLFATLSFHAPVHRLSLAQARDHLELLNSTAREISSLFL